MFGATGGSQDTDKNETQKDNSSPRAEAPEERLKHWLDYTANEVQAFLNESNLGGLASLTSSLGSLGPFGGTLGGSLGGLFGAAGQAYPVPSLKQYRDCVDGDGRSVWTEDGVWRCLFRGAPPPPNAGREFADYTGFLEHQRALLRQREAEVDARLQAQLSTTAPAVAAGDAVFPGNNRPRLISEEEAKGKRVVAQNEASEVVSLGDGRVATRTQRVKHFDDGTALVQRSTSEDEPGSKGWFWN